MKIAFYAPFKPLDHPNPSGDRIIGSGLFRYLSRQGHDLWTASRLRCAVDFLETLAAASASPPNCGGSCGAVTALGPDLWLTYHTYYKAPDLLGPLAAPKARVPYVIFQGIYATKHRRRFITRPGFLLNRRALQAARHVFTNRIEDHRNLARIVPPDRLSYVKPGIAPEQFRFDPAARRQLRRLMAGGGRFRCWLPPPCSVRGSKATGWPGSSKPVRALKKTSGWYLWGTVVSGTGFVPWPKNGWGGVCILQAGFRATRCTDITVPATFSPSPASGRPSVWCFWRRNPAACRWWPSTTAVFRRWSRREQTAFLPPPFARGPFVDALQRLLRSVELRRRMGAAAQAYVREAHDLGINYRIVEEILAAVVCGQSGRPVMSAVRTSHPLRSHTPCRNPLEPGGENPGTMGFPANR